MKIRIVCILLAALVSAGLTLDLSRAEGEARIAVLNPQGILPPIERIPMAPRAESLEGKTIYVVDTKFPRTRAFVETLHRVLQETYPKTVWVLRDKLGNYQVDDPNLWKEIREKGHGVIMGIGH
ncbi:MAG: hypothetical protein GXY47_00515 [Acidobacteria bacterium]|nr:hypothetical protein [Acidobacteriota bacterium]